MNRIFSGSLLLQLMLIVCLIWFGWQADQAMDKSGIGDLNEWNRLNGLAGMAFYCVGLVWMATTLLVVGRRAIGSIQAQLAIGFPPLALFVSWCASWLV